MFSNGIFKANWKRFWIIPVVTTIILFLGITFQMIMKVEDIKEYKEENYYINNVILEKTTTDGEIITLSNTITANGINDIENVVHPNVIETPPKVVETPDNEVNEERYFIRILYNFSNIAVIFIMPVLICILLFGYMNEEKSSSFIHGLPISRKKLYITNIITGITMFILPYVINMIIILVVNLGEMGNYLHTYQIFKWFGISLLYNTIFFSFSALIGMLCASKISHGIFTYILMYAPIGVILLLSKILEEILYGFNAFSSQIEEIALKIPFINIIENFNKLSYYYTNTEINLDIKTIIFYIIASIAMLSIGYFLYKRRKLETTKEFISFKAIQGIIKYVATFCVNLLSYTYFYSIFDKNEIAGFIGAIIVTFIAYFIIEMILKKTYKVFKEIKGFIVYTIIITASYAIVINGAFGFETRIPKIEDIKEVSFINYYDNITFDEKENVKMITDLHKKLVNERKKGYTDYEIEYTLNNGRKLNRKYSIYYGDYKNELKNIYDSSEYIEESIKVLQDTNNIEKIEIDVNYKKTNNRYDYKSMEITEKDKNDFISLLIQDIQNRKATFRNTYYEISEVKMQNIKNNEINNINIGVKLKDNKYRNIHYTNFEDIKIKKYIY